MGTLHYRCSFDLTAARPERSLETILKTIRKWIGDRPEPDKEDDFWKAWFFQGGLWKSQTHPGIRVLTQNCYGDCSCQSPHCWAAEYEHPCDEFPRSRFWRVHIGMEQFDRDQFHFNFQILYDMRPGYLGPEPAAPLPSSPRLIVGLLTSNSWRCTAGSEELSASARTLRVGEGHLFRELIANGERTCPVVLVSQMYPDMGYALNGPRLAKLLAGTAIVYQSESSEVDEELDNLLGEQFSCRKGAVRVYVPGLDFKRTGEERRHRFILPKDIDEWGLDKTIDIIVRGIARRSTRLKGILTPLDVEAVSRQRRLVQLRAEQTDTSKDEWIRLLEKDNDTLNEEKIELKSETARFEEHIEELDDRIRRLEHERDSIKATLARVSSLGDDGERVNGIIDCLTELPKSVSDVVAKIARIHSCRIAFTERAIKSAGESRFDDLHRAWKVLWAMATTLYDLFFERDAKDIPRVFRNETGIELAMTERKITKQDNRKMAQRKDTFMGQEIDITPHVRFDADSTRAYFCAFRQDRSRLIVVGDIGHLSTQGSSKRQRS